jgi:hypothetical protein
MTDDQAAPSTLRVFVNGRGHDVPLGATAFDAVQVADGDEAAAITAGTRGITDSRGLPVAPNTATYAGAIYRTVRARPTAV